MRILDFIRRLTGKDEDSKIRKLTERIFQLKKEKEKLDKELNARKNASTQDISWPQITPPKPKSEKITTFSPREIGKVRTMKELFEQRKYDEEERLRKIINDANKNFVAISSFLAAGNTEKAEQLLFQTAPIIQEVKDEELHNYFNHYKNKIEELKEVQRQREIERKAREEQEKAEREERERIERIRLAEIAAKEKKEKERKAKEYEEKLYREEQLRLLELKDLRDKVTEKKENAYSYINYLKAHGVQYFFHFTDINNLNSIRKMGGLYSWYYSEQHRININNPGGDRDSRIYDSRHGLQDYVRLSFCDDHPMAFHVNRRTGAKIVLLKIKIDVAAFKDTLFSNINAATQNSSLKFGKSIEDLQRVNINATKQHFVSKDSEIFHEHQAECMVKTFVPIEYIVNINNPTRIY